MPFTLNELMKIINGPETHYWLKDRVKDLDDMDPVDALHDVEMLLAVCKARLYNARELKQGGN